MPVEHKTYDVVIIGQGLAGSLLAWQLIQKSAETEQNNLKILVMDNQYHGASSKVAAGIINPITGHRLNLTNQFADYMSVAKLFYQKIENTLNSTYLTAIPQTRLIKNQGQFDYLQKRLQQTEYDDYLLANGLYAEPENSLFKDSFFREQPFGSIEIKQTYRVDVSNLLDGIQSFLKEKNAYTNQKIAYEDIKPTESNSDQCIQIGNITTKNLIFCEGHQAIHNPWLAGLPFKLAKGEILSIENSTTNFCLNHMLNWGNWLLPSTEPNKLLLGSSYEWHETSLETNPHVAEELINSMKNYVNIENHADFAIHNHQAGIRPSTENRQFFIGKIKQLKNAYCFNGFGSKGCLTIPYFAERLSRHLVDDIALEKCFLNVPPLQTLPPELSL
jgi:glycine/D-amino acid oxidase-like deaminating enzyme